MVWRDVVLRLRALLFRRQMDEELNEELNFHLEMQARKIVNLTLTQRMPSGRPN
jgi:hypothetical protein